MAGIRAVRSVCEAVVELLRAAYTSAPPAGFPPAPEFAVYLAGNFKENRRMEEGVSLFLYRVYVNASQRAAQQRDPITNRIRRPALPLELHFFLTIWARDATVQHDLLGWMMRTLEDYAILTASQLNRVNGANFGDDETVELIPGQLTNEELMRIWDDLDADYQLSVPYVARVVRIESQRSVGEGEPVLIRQFDLGTPGA